MKKQILGSVIGTVMGTALLAGSGAVVADDAFAAENFSSTLYFTTNYTYRGTTFSSNDPAIQGSFDWGVGSWFAGAWATSIDPQDVNGTGGTMEVDYYFGWADNLGGVDLMVMPLLYTFPGQRRSSRTPGVSSRNDTTFELWTSAGMGFDSLPGSPYTTLSVNYSPELFDNGHHAWYSSLGVAFSLPEDFGIDFLYGYQYVGGKDSNDFFADDFGHWNVGLTKSAAGFDFDVRWHDTQKASRIGDGFALDGKLVGTVSRTF